MKLERAAKKEDLTICFFGIYDPQYSRNRILMRGLKENGVRVIECRSNKNGIKKYFDLIKKHRRIKKEYDILLVAFPGWHSMILAKFLTGKPIIFDSFNSIYDSEVLDRKIAEKGSLKAKYYWILDWLACKLADKILLDTDEHIKYFTEEFGIKKNKFQKIFVGSSARLFGVAKDDDENGFTVGFYGSHIPLQGVEYVLRAADILKENKDIVFNIIGTKIKKKYECQNFSNVVFFENLPYEKLIELINSSDVCLGIFGNTAKTRRVIPNKIFDSAALKKPAVTADTPAIRELFSEEDLMMVPAADAESLARAILFLKNNPEKANKLAENCHNKFVQNAAPRVLGRRLKQAAEKI